MRVFVISSGAIMRKNQVTTPNRAKTQHYGFVSIMVHWQHYGKTQHYGSLAALWFRFVLKFYFRWVFFRIKGTKNLRLSHKVIKRNKLTWEFRCFWNFLANSFFVPFFVRRARSISGLGLSQRSSISGHIFPNEVNSKSKVAQTD